MALMNGAFVAWGPHTSLQLLLRQVLEYKTVPCLLTSVLNAHTNAIQDARKYHNMVIVIEDWTKVQQSQEKCIRGSSQPA